MKRFELGKVIASAAIVSACNSSAVVGTISGESVTTSGAGGLSDGLDGSGGNGVGANGTGGSDSGAGGTDPVGSRSNAGGTAAGGASEDDLGTSVGGASNEGTGGVAVIVAGPEVTVQLNDVRQLIRGFGINNNWAPLGSGTQTLFGNGDGELGLNILRIGMAPDGGPYNGADTWYEIQEANALSEDDLIVIGTAWSAPANCKTNGSVIDGGHLLQECYESWSDTIAAFPGIVKEGSGVDLYAMSPQSEMDFASCGGNEPCDGNFDSMIMTGAEAAAFQKVLGPKLRNVGTRPMTAEASEWLHFWSNESATGSDPGNLPSSDPLECGFPADNPACLFDFGGYDYGHALAADPDAWSAFDIVGTHQYDTQVAEPWPLDVEKGNKEVWQTEMCGKKWWPEQGTFSGTTVHPTIHIENGVAVARWIHSGLTVGEASAWLWWWFWPSGTDDNQGLLTQDGQIAKRFYTFGNYTKYIRPGYHRVKMTGDFPEKVLMSAYTGDDGTVVIVAVNETTSAQDIPVTVSGGAAPLVMTPYLTSASEDLAAQQAVPVANDGIFQAALPAMSVTTFVGK